MKILVINCGSSSLKFSLLDSSKSFTPIKKGLIDRVKNHKEAIKTALKSLEGEEITAVGHRVVHGGEKYSQPTKITPAVIREIKKLGKLAPLHNPVNLEGILATKKLLPKIPQVAVFDTAFHQTMPQKAFLYALPQKLYKKNNIRRYGFHGTSHKYVVSETLKKLGTKKAKIISCHLGNGSSITASINGKSIDTSMGLTPLEGVMMGTRCGNIDPSIPLHLQESLKMKPQKIYEMLNKHSGLKAISKISFDMRKIYEKSLKNNKSALFTIEMLSYQIAKYCGSYAAALNGLDAITFTGGLGEKAFYVREQTCKYLGFMGLKLDKRKNSANKELISTPKSTIKVFVIPTNEEKQIAIETQKTI